MRVTRIYTGDDGQSHFENIEIGTGAGDTQRSPDFPATAVGLRESDGARNLDFHPAPRRQLVAILAGRLEIEIGDGTKREFGQGELFLADDTSGQGHILRDIGGPHRGVVVPLAPEFDLEAFRGGQVGGAARSPSP